MLAPNLVDKAVRRVDGLLADAKLRSIGEHKLEHLVTLAGGIVVLLARCIQADVKGITIGVLATHYQKKRARHGANRATQM